jgi:hypothetical protein
MSERKTEGVFLRSFRTTLRVEGPPKVVSSLRELPQLPPLRFAFGRSKKGELIGFAPPFPPKHSSVGSSYDSLPSFGPTLRFVSGSTKRSGLGVGMTHSQPSVLTPPNGAKTLRCFSLRASAYA